MATTTTIDFWQRFWRPHASDAAQLLATRGFTVMWALVIIVPALAYTRSEGSILEVLSRIGSYFVGAKLSMFVLGFFSKHTSERGLLIGVAAGFLAVWLVATRTEIAWPWYAVIGSGVNIAAAVAASLGLDGRKANWADWSIPGLLAQRPQDVQPDLDGWQTLPGRLDRASVPLLIYFIGTIALLIGLEMVIPAMS